MRTSILTLAFLTPLGCGIDTTASLNADLDDAFNAEKKRFIEAREADVSAVNRASIQGKNNIAAEGGRFSETTKKQGKRSNEDFNREKQQFVEAREADVSAVNQASIEGKDNIAAEGGRFSATVKKQGERSNADINDNIKDTNENIAAEKARMTDRLVGSDDSKHDALDNKNAEQDKRLDALEAIAQTQGGLIDLLEDLVDGNYDELFEKAESSAKGLLVIMEASIKELEKELDFLEIRVEISEGHITGLAGFLNNLDLDAIPESIVFDDIGGDLAAEKVVMPYGMNLKEAIRKLRQKYRVLEEDVDGLEGAVFDGRGLSDSCSISYSNVRSFEVDDWERRSENSNGAANIQVSEKTLWKANTTLVCTVTGSTYLGKIIYRQDPRPSNNPR